MNCPPSPPTPLDLWRRYRKHLCPCPELGLSLDISRMGFDEGFFARMAEPTARAFAAMAQLEAGDVANPDEQRMVGHYWLRDDSLAPDKVIAAQIRQTLDDVKTFAAAVHDGEIKPPTAPKFTDVLLVGIGGSCLGPQLLADALAAKRDRTRLHFMDNTDPDGFDRLLASLGRRLRSTLVVVVSKSGSTPEPRNGMAHVESALASMNLTLPPQAVAITCSGSRLDKKAVADEWLRRFPMWDWVGGRTSVTSAVGLLPAALQGVNVDELLGGAAAMDARTRQTDTMANPAALMALMWHHATDGRGNRDLVILPYKDGLMLLSRYLQQLVMESLGKHLDLDGRVVEQGLAVYGNKGSTDQHAYVQQLRDGLDNFFATFLVVLEDRPRAPQAQQLEVEPGITSGDYLSGFWQGTREALREGGRQSMTISIKRMDATSLGAIIALFERAVGMYATLINVNAYHQPGVEAGKKAAADVLDIQQKVVAGLAEQQKPLTAEQLADRLNISGRVETVYHVLEHLAANGRGVVRLKGERFRKKGK